ncbi:MAG TPA: hypothetical protein VEA80_08075 [Vitreimonas sp.]|uniref:hypothetical protein n=1 Tax=Vitreimonas sp. TaxID=3069702 RepID=UPI002D53EFC4|nr:hypothetical protein [Vitreimonas sp.]HYD87417.1 hypothetical protein [Vitreimonas sp.]
MLVYGDATEAIDAAAIERAIRTLPPASASLPRRAALTRLLVEAGALGQAILDRRFRARGADGRSADERAVNALLLELARTLIDPRQDEAGAQTRLGAALRAVQRQCAPLPKRGKLAEGFAHYALYPECYIEAAKALPPHTYVIGLRSIGLPLGALVAAASRAAAFTSFRPTGHPFARKLELDPPLREELAAHPGPFAIVDEGPGLSGSSFACAADFLESCAIEADRIHFLPGHSGAPGPQSSAEAKSRWRRTPRHHCSFERVVLPRLSAWAADVAGEACAIEDVSSGAWRRHSGEESGAWLPIFAQQERRKFILRGDHGAFLLKFNGLGSAGARKTAMAEALAEAGFAPRCHGERYGFLVTDWREAAPWRPNAEEAVPHLAAYLGFRARHFKADAGASLHALAQMARHNTAQALGAESESEFDRWDSQLERLDRTRAPIAVDSRLHRWEWLRTAGGEVLKADAVDHHAAHDLIGCQDIAWDIAGATAEFDLADEEQDELCARLRAADVVVSADLLRFLRPCYLAFQLGLWRLAADAALDAVDRIRAQAVSDGYAQKLRCELER